MERGSLRAWFAERRPLREARLLGSLLLVLLVPGLVVLVLQWFDSGWIGASGVVVLAAVLSLSSALVLAYRGYLNASAVLTVATTGLACFASAVLSKNGAMAMAYQCVTILLAGLLLGERAVIITVAVVFAAAVIGLPAFGVALSMRESSSGIVLTAVVGVLLYLALRHRAALEQRRQMLLEHSEARWRAVAQLTPVGIFRANVETKTITGNRAWCDIVGVSDDTTSLDGWLNTVHMSEHELVTTKWHDAVEHGASFDAEWRMVGSDGRVRWVLGRAVPERDAQGRVTAHVGSLTDISAQRRVAEQLRQSEERIRHIFESSPLPMGILRAHNLVIVDVNQAFLTMMGLAREDVVGCTDIELGLWANPVSAQEFRRRLASDENLHDLEWSLRSRAGAIRHLRGSVEKIELDDAPHLLVVGQDVTERKRDELKMQQLSRAMQQSADCVVITDVNGIIEYVNPAFEQLTGWSADQAIGKTPRIVKSGRHDETFYCHMWNTILNGEVMRHIMVNRKKNGEDYFEEKTISPLRDARGQITHFISTGKDVTERVQSQERLRFIAHHDALTSLPNRVLFLDRLTQAMAGAKWQNRLVAVMFIDLDHFKHINDTLGHEAGDVLLCAVAQSLRTTLRERDTIARFGGDEFAVLLSDIAGQQDVAALAEKVLEIMREPVTVQEQKFFLSASIGISLYPHDAADGRTLLRNADTAMYRAKEMGKNTFQFYSAEMSARALERMALERSLRLALEREEFLVYYQPQVDLRDGRIIGVEALLRWDRPNAGIVSPSVFLPLLEDTGLIRPVGEWVLHSVCAQIRDWRAAGMPSIRVAVNLSGQQLRQPGFFSSISRLMDQYDLPAECLELEITENSLLHDVENALRDLDEHSRSRIRLAIDDFGIGYSSLAHLKRLPVDTLKIDRSFVRDAPNDPQDAAITRSIIAMGRSLQLDVVAEGVETDAQLEFLRAEQCHTYQGYFASEPVDAAQIATLISRSAVG